MTDTFSESKNSTLMGFIMLYAYSKDKNWNKKDTPKDNFGFTFHPLWWRFHFDYDDNIKDYNKNITNFFDIISLQPLYGNYVKGDYARDKIIKSLREIYIKHTDKSFCISKEDFIKSYKIWLDITNSLEEIKIGSNDIVSKYLTDKFIPSRLHPQSDDELEILYNLTKEFWLILNEVEKLLYNLDEKQLSELNAMARIKEEPTEFFPICSFTEKFAINTFYYGGLITKLQVRNNNSSSIFTNANIEFDTKKSIEFFHLQNDARMASGGTREANLKREAEREERRQIYKNPNNLQDNSLPFSEIKKYMNSDNEANKL